MALPNPKITATSVASCPTSLRKTIPCKWPFSILAAGTRTFREGNGRGPLADKLNTLSQGLADLAGGLGDLYKDTTIVVMSEFGRTAKENGNGGTDHGHGNAMWLMGGGLEGGKVFGRWGGLASNDLHDQRDLPTSTDFRSVLSHSLSDQMNLSSASLTKIFPDFSDRSNPFVRT